MADARVVALLEALVGEVHELREDLNALAELHVPSSDNRDHGPCEIDDKLMTPRQFAEFLGVHLRTLRAMQNAGEVPPPLRIGRAPRWKRSDIDAWLDQRAGAP